LDHGSRAAGAACGAVCCGRRGVRRRRGRATRGAAGGCRLPAGRTGPDRRRAAGPTSRICYSWRSRTPVASSEHPFTGRAPKEV
ncbi:Os10g0178101, partial [Oryza sativa Japonica Group]